MRPAKKQLYRMFQSAMPDPKAGLGLPTPGGSPSPGAPKRRPRILDHQFLSRLHGPKVAVQTGITAMFLPARPQESALYRVMQAPMENPIGITPEFFLGIRE